MIAEAAIRLRWDTVAHGLVSAGGACLRQPTCGALVDAAWRRCRRSPGSPVRRSIVARRIFIDRC
jgi:hypothetical protein